MIAVDLSTDAQPPQLSPKNDLQGHFSVINTIKRMLNNKDGITFERVTDDGISGAGILMVSCTRTLLGKKGMI